MKQKILYVCDYCHTQYKDEITAQACERNHKQNVIATVAEWKNKMLKDFMGRVE